MMKLKDKRIVVTGGAGFVGSHLVENLVEKRHVDPKNIVIPRSADSDLRLLSNARKVLRGADVVFNLACDVGGSSYSTKHPARQCYNALMLALQVIEAAKDENVEKIVMVSSICAYPADTPLPLREENLYGGLPPQTQDGYGMAKRMAAFLTEIYNREYGLKAVVVLGSNAYGPRDNFDLQAGHVIPSLIRRCLTEKQLVVWGDGRGTRDFLYVEDFAEGLALAAEKLSTPAPVILGSGKEISIRKIVELVVKHTGFKGPVSFDKGRPQGLRRRFVDIGRARRLLGFKPKWDIEKGIIKTIEWYKKTNLGL